MKVAVAAAAAAKGARGKAESGKRRTYAVTDRVPDEAWRALIERGLETKRGKTVVDGLLSHYRSFAESNAAVLAFADKLGVEVAACIPHSAHHRELSETGNKNDHSCKKQKCTPPCVIRLRNRTVRVEFYMQDYKGVGAARDVVIRTKATCVCSLQETHCLGCVVVIYEVTIPPSLQTIEKSRPAEARALSQAAKRPRHEVEAESEVAADDNDDDDDGHEKEQKKRTLYPSKRARESAASTSDRCREHAHSTHKKARAAVASEAEAHDKHDDGREEQQQQRQRQPVQAPTLWPPVISDFQTMASPQYGSFVGSPAAMHPRYAIAQPPAPFGPYPIGLDHVYPFASQVNTTPPWPPVDNGFWVVASPFGWHVRSPVAMHPSYATPARVGMYPYGLDRVHPSASQRRVFQPPRQQTVDAQNMSELTPQRDGSTNTNCAEVDTPGRLAPQPPTIIIKMITNNVTSQGNHNANIDFKS